MIINRKRRWLAITYCLITILLLQISFFERKSYSGSRPEFYPGDCVSRGKVLFWKINSIEGDNYLVLKCYTETDFSPPQCNDYIIEIPVDEFEEEVFARDDEVFDCPSGLRVNILDDE